MKSKVFSYIAVALGIACFVLSIVGFLFSSIDFVSAGQKAAIEQEAINQDAKKGDVVRGVTVKKVKKKGDNVTITFNDTELNAYIIKSEKRSVYIFTVISLALGVLCIICGAQRTEWKPGVVKGFGSLAKIGMMVALVVLLAVLKNPKLF